MKTFFKVIKTEEVKSEYYIEIDCKDIHDAHQKIVELLKNKDNIAANTEHQTRSILTEKIA